MHCLFYNAGRAGSHLLGDIIFNYLQSKHRTQKNLEEYFSTMRYFYYKNGRMIDGIDFTDHDYLLTYDYFDEGEIVRDELLVGKSYESCDDRRIMQRIALIQKYPNNFVKLSTKHLRSICLKRLLQATPNIICLNRKNKMEQYLSNRISASINHFITTTPEQLSYFNTEKITATKYSFDNFVMMNEHFVDFKSTLNAPIDVWYEDFADLENKYEILSMIGYDDWREVLGDVVYKEIHIKVNHNHIDKFNNAEEIQGWFDDWVFEY